MMLSEEALLDSIFETVLRGCNVDVKARKSAIWSACIAMMADVLRETDPFNRERLLRGIEDELRKSIVELDQLLKPTPSNPLGPFKLN